MNLQNQVEAETKRVGVVLKIDQLVNTCIRDLMSIAVELGDFSGLGLRMEVLRAKVAIVHRHLRELRVLAKDQPGALTLIDTSQLYMDKAAGEFRATEIKTIGVEHEERRLILKEGIKAANKDMMLALNSGLLEMATESARKLEQDDTADTRHFIMVLLKCAMGLSVVLGIVGATIYSRHLVGRLSRVRANATYLASGKPLLSPLPGGDEISQLDQSFHWAAELIEQNMRKEKAILTNARDVICSFDDRFRLKSINPAGEKLLCHEADVLTGRSFLTLIASGDKKEVEAALSQIVKTGTSAELSASLLADQEEDAVPVDISVSYSPMDKTYYAVIHDVTLKRQLEQVKQQVTAMITHDLRTPLQSLRNYLEMLRIGKLGQLNERGLKLLDLTEQESQRMTRLIDSVLQLEKLRSGAIGLELQPVPLADILPKSVGAVQLIAAGHSIAIGLEPSDLIVMGDATWLEQVFVNILANAINYSPAGSRVSVSAQRKGDFGEVRVSDQGAGIAEEEKALIFERFHRVSASAQKVTGSGLGLTICKELVELHRGYIHVESELGKGSTFIIGIPILAGAILGVSAAPSDKA